MGLIAENLRFLRKQKKLTIAETGERLRIPPSTYSSYEYGKAEPDAKMQLAICEFFGINLTDFLTKKLGTGNPSEKGYEHKTGKKGNPKDTANGEPKGVKGGGGMLHDPGYEYRSEAQTIEELQQQIREKDEMVSILQFALKIAQERITALEQKQKKG